MTIFPANRAVVYMARYVARFLRGSGSYRTLPSGPDAGGLPLVDRVIRTACGLCGHWIWDTAERLWRRGFAWMYLPHSASMRPAGINVATGSGTSSGDRIVGSV